MVARTPRRSPSTSAPIHRPPAADEIVTNLPRTRTRSSRPRDFGFSDVRCRPDTGQRFASIRCPTAGALTLNGNPVAAGRGGDRRRRSRPTSCSRRRANANGNKPMRPSRSAWQDKRLAHTTRCRTRFNRERDAGSRCAIGPMPMSALRLRTHCWWWTAAHGVLSPTTSMSTVLH